MTQDNAPQFTLEKTGQGGRYLATIAGKPDPAELTFKDLGDHRILVDHVGVPVSLRGTGLGVALARHVVERARAEGFKIRPQCPFMVSQAQKNPDWSDVVESV